MKQILFKIYPK